MSASTRDIRVRLPLSLRRKLQAIATREKTDVSALIVNAVRADIARGRAKRVRRKPLS